MREWQVYLSLPGTDHYGAWHADELLERLKRWHAAISLGGSHLEVTMTVRATSPAGALDKGLRIVKRAVPTALPEQLLSAEVRPMELAGPQDYLGVAELAEYLDVSKGRLAELASRPRFPRPVAQLKSGPVWKLSSVVRYASSRRRSPGRPRSAAAK